MEIIYDNSKVEKSCKNIKEAKKLYNKEVAEKLHSTINFIENATTLMDIKNMPSYHLHQLQGDRKGTYAIDLGRRLGFRLIIIPLDENKKKWKINDDITIYNSTTIIIAEEVTNHYE
jgi:proteic killer suppression protein